MIPPPPTHFKLPLVGRIEPELQEWSESLPPGFYTPPTSDGNDNGADVPDDATLTGGSWDYRIREHREVDGTPHYEIVEVYYDDQGNPNGWAEAAAPHGDSVSELRDDMESMLTALDRPIYLDGVDQGES